MNLTVVIITKNEEQNIGRCLESVRWADEIVVVDSMSTDQTVTIARQFGANVLLIKWRGYGPAKREGVAQATGEWILSLDADEEVTRDLSAEIKSTIEASTDYAGFYINRRTNFLGRWISHCGWYPDPVLRLFLKSKGNVNKSPVHEKVVLEGKVGRLKGEILHYSYPSLEKYFAKFDVYTTMGAEEAYKRGKQTHWFDLVFRPLVSFIAHYISRQGFRDGMEGFLISVLSSIAVMVKYAKLRQLCKERGKVTAKLHAENN